MNPQELPPVEFLRECVSYDPQTGLVRWLKRPLHHFVNSNAWGGFNSRYAGSDAGTKRTDENGDKMLIQICITQNGSPSLFPIHRIIFALMGLPLGERNEVDHKDGDPWNNKWDNLRIATHSQNQCNIPTKPKRRRSGILLPKGVSVSKSKYRATIKYCGKFRHIGVFPTPEAAKRAYDFEASKTFGEFSCAV